MKRKLFASLTLAALFALPVAAQQPSTTDTQSTTTTTTTPDTQDKGNPSSSSSQGTTQWTPDGLATGSTNTYGDQDVQKMEKTPVFRVKVVERSLQAVNYQHLSGSTDVDLIGTNLMPEARGKGKITSHTGRIQIDTRYSHLQPATKMGPQFLTYVLWAITPEGRPMNLGEVIPRSDGTIHMTTTTDLQSFGLMVTAEPYFAVTRPSSMVVMENQIPADVKGWERPVTARYESLDRSEYTADIDPATLPATGVEPGKVPLNLLEARNAVAIAEAEGAAKYAPEALARAKDFLARGEDYLNRKQSNEAIGTVARGAIQDSEDARLITLRKKRDERLAQERAAQQQRVDEARMRADEQARAASEAQQRADVARQNAAQAQQDREAALQAKQQADAAAQEAARQRAEAEQARQAALQQQQALAAQMQQAQQQAQQAQQQAQQAQLAAQRAEQEREATRQRLMTQLNQVLQTKDTARGLIVNMSDVLFDFNKATLKSGAKLRLAKVAGIIQAYPDLKLSIEGFTDNIGSDQYNLQLSEKRADAVRDFLVSQGVSQNAIQARGFGKANPVASNTSASGRQMNRRVDLVVSGEAIQSARSQQQGGENAATGGTTGAAAASGSNLSTAPPSGSDVATPAASTNSTVNSNSSNTTTTDRTTTYSTQTPGAATDANGNPVTSNPNAGSTVTFTQQQQTTAQPAQPTPTQPQTTVPQPQTPPANTPPPPDQTTNPK